LPFLKIIEEDAALVEIGPRFVLNLIKIFQGSFGGPTLYENPHYQSPNMVSCFCCLVVFDVPELFGQNNFVK
jgi:hypothetical protein